MRNACRKDDSRKPSIVVKNVRVWLGVKDIGFGVCDGKDVEEDVTTGRVGHGNVAAGAAAAAADANNKNKDILIITVVAFKFRWIALEMGMFLLRMKEFLLL
jgi:hypothetical protein